MALQDSGRMTSTQDIAEIRKLFLKLCTVIGVRVSKLQLDSETRTMVLERNLAYIFDTLNDKRTVLRLAASKSLGLIVKRLGQELSLPVLDFLFSGLDSGSGWQRLIPSHMQSIQQRNESLEIPNLDDRHFISIDHQLWHGSTYSLAHVMLAQAIPDDLLIQVCHFISAALNFCKKSGQGTLVGEDVREAACLCVWVLVRKYNRGPHLDSFETQQDLATGNCLQGLVLEMIKAACLDPSNNVRRAASAALQETIGRHPSKVADSVELGRELSTIVDSQGVSSRQVAMLVTALKVSRLSHTYWRMIAMELCRWRGLMSEDLKTRRLAAKSLACIAVKTANDTKTVIQLLVDDLLLREDEGRRQGAYYICSFLRL